MENIPNVSDKKLITNKYKIKETALRIEIGQYEFVEIKIENCSPTNAYDIYCAYKRKFKG